MKAFLEYKKNLELLSVKVKKLKNKKKRGKLTTDEIFVLSELSEQMEYNIRKINTLENLEWAIKNPFIQLLITVLIIFIAVYVSQN